MKSIIKISLALILIVGCTSCDKVEDLLYGSLPDIVEVDKIEDFNEDVLLCRAGEGKALGINTKTEEVYELKKFIKQDGDKLYYKLADMITFKEGALVYLTRVNLYKLYRYYPKEGKLKKVDIDITKRGWVRIDEDKIWIGSGERPNQTSKVAIYSISQDKIIEYRNITYFIKTPTNMGGMIKFNNKRYIAVNTNRYDMGGGLYNIDDNKFIDLGIKVYADVSIGTGEGDIFFASIRAKEDEGGTDEHIYKIKSLEPLSLEKLLHFKNTILPGNKKFVAGYTYDIEDKYFITSFMFGKTLIVDKDTYAIDTTIYNYPKFYDEVTGAEYTGRSHVYYRNGYIWTFGDLETRKICRLDPKTLEVKFIDY